MAKRKNEGFTLIEIMIAIAILTILLVPIMRQFAQTLETSRKAKELQYVNENAGYVLELAQRTDLSTLEHPAVSQPAEVADDVKINTWAKYTITCDIYNIDGSQVGGTNGQVNYTATTYTLNDVKLGAKRHLYGRKVIADDLSAKLADMDVSGQGYKVSYSMTSADLANFPNGFELTNEGSIVRYNSQGFVTAVACYSTDRVTNPNDTNLGNMQNLDVTKVAIIPGTAQSFDEQALTQFFSIAMEELKRSDYESWVQAMTHNLGDSTLNSADYRSSFKKVTKIYIDKDDNATASDPSDDFYVIKADVYYSSDYVINGVSLSDKVLTYNVFSQKFKTDRCPDIYFEYQPYATKYVKSPPSVEYALEDDIIIDNYVQNPDTPYDDDYDPDNVKLYLYKPTMDQSNTTYGLSDNDHAYYIKAGSTQKVKIHIYRANGSGYPVDIYTNLYKENAGSQEIDHDQFLVTNRTTISGVKTDSVAHASDNVRVDYSYDNINILKDDKRSEDRLLTITVRLTPKDDNRMISEVKLTGAKGEN